MRAVSQLHVLQADTGLDQVGCIAVAKALGRDLFFSPQAMATWCIITCRTCKG